MQKLCCAYIHRPLVDAGERCYHLNCRRHHTGRDTLCLSPSNIPGNNRAKYTVTGFLSLFFFRTRARARDECNDDESHVGINHRWKNDAIRQSAVL